MDLMNYLLIGFGGLFFLIFLYTSIVIWMENKFSAGIKFFLLLFPLPILFFITGLFNFRHNEISGILLLSITVLTGIIFLFPSKTKKFQKRSIPAKRIDERDTMFSRKDLVPGTRQFLEYYYKNPEKKELDDQFRKFPGLLKPGTLYFNRLAFAAAEASFSTIEQFHSLVAGNNTKKAEPVDLNQITRFIKTWARKLGALNIGITELHEYHLYSVGGRYYRYDREVINSHPFAIAVIVEMDYLMMSASPAAPAVMESAQQYLNSGSIATQIAQFIRNLGYSARAHIDANYELICPLVARDAGLGEIGRMGLLITPDYGPRVRISVVTTDLPLIIDHPTHDPSVLDFCTKCKKCAGNCPAQAISYEKREEINGALRWQINSEACYSYWCKVGTDCGKCIAVCPYSHSNNLLHNLVRKGLRNSNLFRNLAIKLDDIFYDSKPVSKSSPDWM
jgi:reductive dehalogenase